MNKNNDFWHDIRVPEGKGQQGNIDPRMSELLELRRRQYKDEEKRKYMEQMEDKKRREQEKKYAEKRFVDAEKARIAREERLHAEKERKARAKARKRTIAGFIVAASLFTAGVGTYETIKTLDERKNRIDAQAEIEDSAIQKNRILQKSMDENGNIIVTYDNPRPAYYSVLASSNIDEIIANNSLEDAEKLLKDRELDIAWLTLKIMKASLVDGCKLPKEEVDNVRTTNSPRDDVNYLNISIPSIGDFSDYYSKGQYNHTEIQEDSAKKFQKAIENIYALENNQKDKPTRKELIKYYNEIHRLLETGNFIVNDKGEIEFKKGFERTIDEPDGR